MVHVDLDKDNIMNDEVNETLPSDLLSENPEDKALEAIEDAVRMPTLPDIAPKNLPTLGNVFGRGKLAELRSFGGKTLAENMDRVDSAIKKTRELNSIYNRNHSEWTRRMINMDHYDPWFNMRQVSAEMSSRRAALNDAKYKHLKNEVKMRRMMRDLERLETKFADQHLEDYNWKQDEEAVDELDIFDLKIEISEMQEGILNGMSYIEGAMKEVLILEDLYEQLKKQINNFSEADYEEANARAHLRQAISQSLRDVRAGGHITKGEQRLLEQIGVNPGKLQIELQKFIEQCERNPNHDDISVGTLKNFVEQTAEQLIPVTKMKSEMWGFEPEPRLDYMYTDKIGLLDKPEESEE